MPFVSRRELTLLTDRAEKAEANAAEALRMYYELSNRMLTSRNQFAIPLEAPKTVEEVVEQKVAQTIVEGMTEGEFIEFYKPTMEFQAIRELWRESVRLGALPYRHQAVKGLPYLEDEPIEAEGVT
jgi:5-methylcytosine-specific restriction endonuclease McrBC regulatory subunit McrC